MSNTKQALIVAAAVLLLAALLFGLWSESRSAERNADDHVEDLRDRFARD